LKDSKAAGWYISVSQLEFINTTGLAFIIRISQAGGFSASAAFLKAATKSGSYLTDDENLSLKVFSPQCSIGI